MRAIFTIGHSTRTWHEFLALLEEHAINKLIDIRRFPGSRRYPQFNREALAQALADASIDYRHEPLLGGRRAAKANSVNDYWRHPSFRGFADYMATDEFRQAVEHLRQDSTESNLVLMCAEAVPWRCHRQLVADALVASGHEVIHILGRKRHETHQLNSHARQDATGRLTYHADMAQLALDFDKVLRGSGD